MPIFTQTLRLCDAALLLARLRQVDDDPDLTEHFYPLLLAHADEQIALMDLSLVLDACIAQYAKYLPLLVEIEMHLRGDQFLHAMLLDEPQLHEQAKVLWRSQHL